MINFEQIPVGELNAKTGELSGVENKPKPLPSIGIDTDEFHRQVLDLVNKKVPIEKAYGAIDQHKEITDKPRAKSMAQAIYSIAEKK